jgi:hypothetical protein
VTGRARLVFAGAIALAVMRGGEARTQEPAGVASRDVPGADMVAGYWRADEAMELFRSGAALLYRWPGRMIGRYEFVSADRMLLTFGFAGIPGDYRVTRDGDVLRLCETDRPARCLRFVRAERPEDAALEDAVEGPPRLAPTPAYPSREASAAEVGPVLQQIKTLQHSHWQETGSFAARLEDLPGYEPQPLRNYHQPVIRSVSADGFCVDVQPRGRGLYPVFIRNGGQPERGTCAEAF